MKNHINGELSQYVDLQCRQNKADAERQSQLGGEAVVPRSPQYHGIVGDKQGVDEHDSPSPGDCLRLSKGIEQQVEL